MSEQVFTFDDWCDKVQIKGNWREKLFHSLAARFGGIDKIPNDVDVWADEWSKVLDYALSNLPPMR